MLAGAMSARVDAAPVRYDTQFTPQVVFPTLTSATGPAGTGSFVFDMVTGQLSEFVWAFSDGSIGGTNQTQDKTPQTRHGLFLFEILSQTDVYRHSNCVRNGCGMALEVTDGVGPAGANRLQLSSTRSGQSTYLFHYIDSHSLDWVAQGLITIAPSLVVPEPSSIALTLCALGAGAIRRRSYRNQKALDRKSVV